MKTGNELYTATAYDLSRKLTLEYSSSFGLASKLFAPSIRKHIYAIYGVVRIADEIVDTYIGSDKSEQIDAFQNEVHAALQTGYSTNPIVHVFAQTARQFNIDLPIIDPFFASMKTDLTAKSFNRTQYKDYIYGSAEVIGLMCLKVFCQGDTAQYHALAPGARQLGSAYQKVNFLRDFAADYQERGRVYFPGVTYAEWNDEHMAVIITDIRRDFASARSALKELPAGARTSVYISYVYYRALLKRLERMTAQQVLTKRAHVPTPIKLALFASAPIGARFL